MSNRFYIYMHYRADQKEGLFTPPFYIGKGCGDRAFDKMRRNDYWKNIVKKHGVRVKVRHINLSEKEAYIAEKCIIRFYQKKKFAPGCEANLQDGGKGGYQVTNEVKEKISQGLIQYFKTHDVWNKGIPCTEEQKENLKRVNTGKKQSKETREKMSKAQKKRKRPSGIMKRSWETRYKNIPEFIVLNAQKEIVWRGKNKKECSKALNLSSTSTYRGLRKGLLGQSYRGYTFQYVEELPNV